MKIYGKSRLGHKRKGNDMLSKVMVKVSYVALLVTAIGCQSPKLQPTGPIKCYDGPELDRSEVALIRCKQSPGGSILITRIRAHPGDSEYSLGNLFSGGVDEVLVAPGTPTV